MSELNPDFRNDDDHPDFGDKRAVIDWLEDASVSNEERARRADRFERGDGTPAKRDDDLSAALAKARGEGAPAPTHDTDRTSRDYAEENKAAQKGRSKPKG